MGYCYTLSWTHPFHKNEQAKYEPKSFTKGRHDPDDTDDDEIADESDLNDPPSFQLQASHA